MKTLFLPRDHRFPARTATPRYTEHSALMPVHYLLRGNANSLFGSQFCGFGFGVLRYIFVRVLWGGEILSMAKLDKTETAQNSSMLIKQICTVSWLAVVRSICFAVGNILCSVDTCVLLHR